MFLEVFAAVPQTNEELNFVRVLASVCLCVRMRVRVTVYAFALVSTSIHLKYCCVAETEMSFASF